MIPIEDKQHTLAIITEAVESGARKFMACATLEISTRTLQRWERDCTTDQRKGAVKSVNTIVKIILTYPFALTYGYYWAQFGTLSPLFLAFAPLIFVLPKSTLWRESKLAAIGIATLIGLLFWIVLYPSYFMPRYFLATLFILSIPIAAGTDIISRQRTILSLIIPITVFLTIVITPRYTNFQFAMDAPPTFNRHGFKRFLVSGEKSFLYADDFSYTLAHKAINLRANQNDRILMLTYYRLWLRPDLLQKVSTSSELAVATNPETNFPPVSG